MAGNERIAVSPDHFRALTLTSLCCIVNVKWGKQTFSDLELDTSSDVMTFKAVLFSLSNVLPEKQKLMVKGKVMKDDDPLTKFTFKDGITLMMMGTAEE